MSEQASATFQINAWNENTWEGQPSRDVQGAKMTRAEISKTYQGDLEGEGTLQYLMTYAEDGTATVIGLERFVGRLGNRTGSFVFQHEAFADASGVRGTATVVPGSGTGDLKGLRGEDRFAYGHLERYPVTFTYEFES